MQIPLQISFHGIAHSDALHDAIREKAGKLERYYDRIVSCRVVLELSGRHRRKGKQYAVRIDLKVPGGEMAVAGEHDTRAYSGATDPLLLFEADQDAPAARA